MVKSPLFVSARALELAQPSKADIAVKVQSEAWCQNGSMHRNKKSCSNRRCNEGILPDHLVC